MREDFYEETALMQDRKNGKIKYTLLKIASIIDYVLIFVWFFLVFYFFGMGSSVWMTLAVLLLPMVIFFLLGFFTGKIKNNVYADFDYTFVSGSVRISKVMNDIKRKHILNFDTHQIEKIGKVGSETYEKYKNMTDVSEKIFTLNKTPEDGKLFYYIVINNPDKTILVLECTEKFIAHIVSFTNNRNLIEDNFK